MSTLRRHPILAALLALALLAAAAVALFVATFDLDRYRERLTAQLEAAVNRPIHLGAARLTIHRGLALDFSDLRIGAPEDETLQMSAAHLYLLLDPLQLLRRRLALEEIVIDSPRLRLNLAPTPAAAAGDRAPQPLLIDAGLLESLLVRSLVVKNGSILLHDRRDPERPFDFEAERISGTIGDLALDSHGRIDLRADLVQDGAPANLHLAGTVTPPSVFDRWREAQVDLALDLVHLDPAPLLPRPAGSSGRLSLRLALQGSPASGLRVDGELAGERLALHLPDAYAGPIALKRLAAVATWSATADGHAIDELTLSLNELPLTGEFALQRRTEGLWLQGELASPGLDVAELALLLPERAGGAALRARRPEGSLRLASLGFAGPLGQLRRADEAFGLVHAHASLHDGTVDLGRLGPLEGLQLTADWREGTLTLTDGRGRLTGGALDFAGTLQRPPKSGMQLQGEVRGALDAATLLALLPEESRHQIEAGGPLPVSATVAGTPERLLVDLEADLTGLDLRREGTFAKEADLAGRLFLTGEVTPQQLEVSHALLAVAPLELRARASLTLDGKRPFAVTADLAPLDLEQLRRQTPLLEPFAPRGELALHYEVEGHEKTIERREGTLSLRDFGLHLRGAVADISQANGEILIRGNRAEGKHLTARIGSSLVEIDGAIEDLSAIRAELHVRGKAIRAEDLIFPSDRAMLRDVDGRLVISREGLDFAPVRVRLDGGTRATVSGTLRNFQAPETLLDIEAEYGNIDEVIALWQRSPDKPLRAKKNGSKKRKVSLLITVRAHDGNLWAMPFQDAEGEITLRNGALVIEPLRFRSGKGTCTAQVAVDRDDSPALLKISGHLDDFDAANLHHDLLRKRGLVTGTLSGDFYLEGRVGKAFLPTSVGGFSLKVKNGVLRRFTVLSRVFSLLNVSQIFALRLPDMDREGMPFERLDGNITLRDGVLSSEDLFIKSNAMNLSLVGSADLKDHELDLVLGVKPLRTVDKIVTQIPLAGWLLTGEEKALLTAHFKVGGTSDAPEVLPVPITSLSEKVFGIFKRVLGLPGKVVTDVEELFSGESAK